jgi:class 3 adenylate cyclase/tetratricopeptide (TPR) repeat protein
MAEQTVCAACGRENDPDQRFCGGCGAPLAAVCGKCGEPNPAGFAFCGRCGAPLGAQPAAPPEREERRVVTVLFADLVGFTSRAEQLDPEDVRSILAPYYAHLRAELERCGGTVEKFIGDAVVAVFGAPVAHGDDPERAVRAALTIRDAIRDEQADGDLGLKVRIAVNTGEALVSLGPSFAEGEGMLAGDVVNTCARLQAAAPVNGVLVGERTYLATRSIIRYERVEPLTVRGKRDPVPAWVALEAIAAPAERIGGTAPLVGRARELGVLKEIWSGVVAERRPQLVTILGEPGIGKTRLTAEFVAEVEANGGRAIRGRTLPYAQTGAFAAFAQQVKQVAGIFDTDPTDVARDKLTAAVRRLVPAEDVTEVGEHVAALIGLMEGGGVAQRQVAFYGARKVVEGLAREQPTVLVFEDIHWAEPSLLELLDSLASRLRDSSVLLLTLARPELLESRPTWGGGLTAYTALPLERLGSDAAHELAAELLGDASADAVRLAETAEGNPLFIEELAASVAEGATTIGSELPTNVRGIIAARLDVLPERERALVLDGAVVGKVFWRGALSRLGWDSESTAELLDALERRDLVRRESVSRIAGDEQYVFKHMLIREVAYATVPRAVRRTRHAALAAFFEDAAGERIGEWAALIAHHWREAADAERELRAIVLAAERAWASEAIDLYTRALELVAEDDVATRRRLRLARAVARVQAGDFAGADGELGDLLPELEGRERYTALEARARATFWLIDPERAEHFGNAAASLAEELGDAELQARALGVLTMVRAMVGDVTQALEQVEAALEMWVPETSRREQGEAMSWAALECYWTGKYERCEVHGRRALAVGEETSHLEALLSGGAHVGLALAGQGRHEEALSYFERAAARGIELELQPRLTGRLTNMWAGVLRELMDLPAARSLNEQAIEYGVRAAFPAAQISGKIDVLHLDLLEGEVGRAVAAWPDLWVAAVETKGWHQWLWMTRLRAAKAEIEHACGRHDDAVAEAIAAVELAERFTRPKYELLARRTLAAALLELDRTEEAVVTLRAASEIADELGHPPSKWAVAATLARALERIGDDAGAESAAAAARATLLTFADQLSPERRQRLLAAPQLEEIIAPVR